jgi:hypothetical protein
MIGNNEFGNYMEGCSLIEVLLMHLLGGSEEDLAKNVYQESQCPSPG